MDVVHHSHVAPQVILPLTTDNHAAALDLAWEHFSVPVSHVPVQLGSSAEGFAAGATGAGARKGSFVASSVLTKTLCQVRALRWVYYLEINIKEKN